MKIIVKGAYAATVEVSDDATLLQLRQSIANVTEFDLQGIKLLFLGKNLRDDSASIESLGLKNGKAVMLIYSGTQSSSSSSSSSSSKANTVVDLAEYRQQELERLSKVIKRMSERDDAMFAGYNFVPELLDQHNRPINISKDDKRALSEAILMHAKGRYVLATAEKEAKIRLRQQQLHPETATDTPMPCTDTDNRTDASSSSSSSTNFPGNSLPLEHTTGQSTLNWEQSEEFNESLRSARSTALSCYLLAVNAFDRVQDKKLLTMIDNPAHLYLDVVWLYYRLNDINNLEAANEYLQRAIDGFRIAHGANLERLFALSGPNCLERILYVRLHLLQGILAFYKGDTNSSMIFLNRAQSECNALVTNPFELETLVNLGYKRKEALAALRATVSSSISSRSTTSHSTDIIFDERIGRAINYAIEARSKKQEKLLADEVYRRNASRQRRLGATVSGYNINIELLDNIVGMGFEEALTVEALRQSNNNELIAIETLTSNVGALISAIEARYVPPSLPNTTTGSSNRINVDTTGAIGRDITSTGKEEDSGSDADEDYAEMEKLAANLQGASSVLDNEKWYSGLSTGDAEENALQEEGTIIESFLKRLLEKK